MSRKHLVLILGLCVGVFHVGAGADPTIELRPISASGSHTIVGNEIALDGGGQRVFLEVYLSDWDPNLTGLPTVQGWQASLNAAGYSSGASGQLVPASEPCVDDAACVAAFGAFATCGYPIANPVECTPGFIDSGRADYIYQGFVAFPAIDVSQLNFRWGAAALGPGATDSGTPVYGGTLVLDVPVDATGTFTVGFRLEPETTMQDASLLPISPLSLVPAVITIGCVTDADCDDGDDCTDDVCNAGVCESTSKIIRMVVRCKPDGKMKALLLTTFPSGTPLTLTNNGGEPKNVVINAQGQGKGTWSGQASGPHEVCLVECPQTCKTVECPSAP